MRFLGISAAMLCGAWAARAEGAGFAVSRFAGEHGHPTTENATAAYYNPAALTLSDGSHLLLDLNVAYRRLTYERIAQPSDAPAPPDAPDANVGRALLSNWLFGPTLAASTRAGDFAFGAIFCIPFGAPVSFEQREKYADHPRLAGPVDGVSRWHSIQGVFVTGQFSVAAAYRPKSSGFSLGASLSLMHSILHDVRARADGSNDVEQEGRSLIEASGSAPAFGVGVAWEAARNELWLGISYQSRPNVRGGMKLTGTVENLIGSESHAKVDVHYDLPDVIRAGARYRPERDLELRLFGDYTRWSAFDRQCIVDAGHACTLLADGSQPPGGAVLQNLRREWHDAVELRAGMSYFASPSFEFFSGIGADSSAVPDATFEPGLPDFAGASFTLGVRHNLSKELAIAASYTEFVFATRHVHGELAADPLPTRQPDASGTYQQVV
ncbi:MAG TPA: outer membrane protein transport protein, partial [Polyangiaceae bacterium]|nr:outer membrane protein transport protein [Polyangiaceae bacterium]